MNTLNHFLRMVSLRSPRISTASSRLRWPLVGAVLAVASQLTAATFFVSPSGSDTNPGSETQPYLTVQKGLSVAQPGDTVQLMRGTYAQSIKTVRNGTANQRIVVDGRGEATLLQFTFAHSNVVLQNVTVTGPNQPYSQLVYFDFNAHFCVLSNTVMDAALAPKVYGIAWRGPRIMPFGLGETASDNLIISNVVKRVQAITLMSIMGDRNIVRGNQLLDSGQVDFVRLFGRSNIFSGNICSNNYSVANAGNHPDFIQTFGNNGHGSWGHIIEQNLVINMPGGQLTQLEGNLVPEIGNWTFRNNAFVNIGLGASCSIPQIRYFNNLFYRCNFANGGHALNFGPRSYGGPNDTAKGYNGLIGLNYPHGCEVKNNIFLECGDSRNTVGWYAFSQDLTGISADHNYVGKAGYASVDVDKLKRPVGTSGGWATWGGWWEPRGINGGNPKIPQLSALNFQLAPDSFLIDRGGDLGSGQRDLLDRLRPQGAAMDIGPIEYTTNSSDPNPPGLPPSPPQNLRVVSP